MFVAPISVEIWDTRSTLFVTTIPVHIYDQKNRFRQLDEKIKYNVKKIVTAWLIIGKIKIFVSMMMIIGEIINTYFRSDGD